VEEFIRAEEKKKRAIYRTKEKKLLFFFFFFFFFFGFLAPVDLAPLDSIFPLPLSPTPCDIPDGAPRARN
jgi:hypothetical protein